MVTHNDIRPLVLRAHAVGDRCLLTDYVDAKCYLVTLRLLALLNVLN